MLQHGILNCLRGEISSSATTTSWTKQQTGSVINIPQISTKDVIYNTVIKKSWCRGSFNWK